MLPNIQVKKNLNIKMDENYFYSMVFYFVTITKLGYKTITNFLELCSVCKTWDLTTEFNLKNVSKT